MIKKKNFILLILFFIFLQVTILHYFQIFGVKPDLFLIIVVVVSLYPSSVKAPRFNKGNRACFEVEPVLVLSFLCGILKDTFSIGSWGMNTFFLPVLSFFLRRLSSKVVLDNTLILCVGVFLSAIFYDIISRIVLGCSGISISFWVFLKITLLESLYSALIFLLTFKLIKKIAL